jgi:flavin reductase (DIM6/NTAB) family NADH-FMN oxidoreductase RutF
MPSSLELRRALGNFATGVTVVTTQSPATPHLAARDAGLTVNSFNSVSLSPPLVLWSLSRHSKLLPAFSSASHYAVHVLHAGQQDLATRFASPVEDRFAGLELTRGVHDLPLLPDFLSRFICRIEQRLDGGDHVILLGRVEQFDSRDGTALTYWRGKYASMAPV